VGATDRKGSLGSDILQNILAAENSARLYAVNPHREKAFDLPCYANVCAMPEPPDLCIIATPAMHVSDIVEDCGKAGVKAIIIVSSGFVKAGVGGKVSEAPVLDIAKSYGMRIVGTSSAGIANPLTGINATLVGSLPGRGQVAFVSQNGPQGLVILDWAISADISLRAFASLGSTMDVDLADLITFFGEDRETRSIIMQIDSLVNVRKFISAARRFARSKPIIVLLDDSMDVSPQDGAYYDALFYRAGIVRVENAKDLFNCAEVLNSFRPPEGLNLAIISNDSASLERSEHAVIKRGGSLPSFGEETRAKLRDQMHLEKDPSNPLDIFEDADARQYVACLDAVAGDGDIDGIILACACQEEETVMEIAKAVGEYVRRSSKPILFALEGCGEFSSVRQLLSEYRLPAYETTEEAIMTYVYMYQYVRNLKTLYETPEELPFNLRPSKNHLKVLVGRAVREGRSILNEEESKRFTEAYGIATTIPYLARRAEDAVEIASRQGYPVKIYVSLLPSEGKSGEEIEEENSMTVFSGAEVRNSHVDLMRNARKVVPANRIEGIMVQKVVVDYDGSFVLRGSKKPVVGPIITFISDDGRASADGDMGVGLPPLNQVLARQIIDQSLRRQSDDGGKPLLSLSSMRSLEEALIKFSNIIVDFPEVAEIEVSPLVLVGDVSMALNVRITLDGEAVRSGAQEYSHLVISPYPSRYGRLWACRGGRTVLLRPIRPEDEALERDLLANLSDETLKFRFFYVLRNIPHDMLARFCNIDYDREIAIMAEYIADGMRRSVGVGRMLIDLEGESGEFAVLVAEDFQSNGLGEKLVDVLIGIARERGLKSIFANVLSDNVKMLTLGRKLGLNVENISFEEKKLTLHL
jgi:acetyltransferase